MKLRQRCTLCALWLASMPAARPVAIGAVFVLNLIHPLIHGTPADSGSLDAILGQLDAVAAGLANGV